MPHRAINSDFQSLFHLKFDKEMAEVGFFQLFFYLGRNLVVLSLAYHMFVNLEYAIWQICFYYMVGQLMFFVVSPFVGLVIQKIGLKHAIALRPAALCIFWLALPYVLVQDFWLSILCMLPFFLIRGLGGTTSVLAYDIFLSHHLNRKNKGKSLALLQIAIMASTVLAPIIGGFVTAYAGFIWTTYIGLVFFIIAGIVLMLTPDEKFKCPYSVKKFLKDTPAVIPAPLAYAEFGRVTFDSVIYLIWPVFLVVAIGDISKIGLLAGASSGVAMIVAYWIGKQMDKGGTKTDVALRHGAYRSMLLNFIRGVWWEPITLGLVDSINKINDQTIKVPYDMQFYKWINEKDTLERAHARLFYDQGIYLLIFAFGAMAFYAFPQNQTLIFIACFLFGSMSLWFTQRISEVGRTVLDVELDTERVVKEKEK